jgi:uncharacterized protein (DUF927 family)
MRDGDRNRSAEEIAREETEDKTELSKWADDLADKVIKAVLEDVALRFLEGGEADDDELGSLDLTSEYDPIVDEKSGSRLSETIKQSAENFRKSEKILRRRYHSVLYSKWKEQQQRQQTYPEFSGTFYGRSYMTTRHGVWVRLNVGGVDDLGVWRRITKTRIDLVARSRDTTRHRNVCHRFRITDEFGESLIDIPAQYLGKDANRAINMLMRCAVRTVESREARQQLAKFLRLLPRGWIIRASRVGWFEWRKHWVYVLPGAVLGDIDDTREETIVLDAITGHHGFHQSGTSDEWREQVAKPLARNTNAILAAGVFLVAPLLRWANEPPGGFHSWGQAKIGKTLEAAFGQSLYGKPYRQGAASDAFGFTWETTANRLEQRAALRNDVGLGLDEIGVGDKKSIAAAIYKLAGGVGKGRMDQDEIDFNVLFYSTGEPSLADFLLNVQPGQMVRLADVPAEVQSGSAFETIPEHEIVDQSRKFYELMDEFHGSAGYDYLQLLVTLTPKEIRARVKKGRTLFLAQPEVVEIIKRAHPQVSSVVGRFALLAVALAIAIEAGILPWAVADTDAGIIACMQRWVNQRVNIDTTGELLRQIEQRRKGLAATINHRFIHLRVEGRRLVPASAADQEKMNAADKCDGYVKDEQILVKPKAWQGMWEGLDIKVVNKLLLREKLLIPDRDGSVPKPEKFKTGASAVRFYVLALAFIDVTAVTSVTEKRECR